MTHTSREYAEALFALGADEGKTAEYAAALAMVEQELKENPGFLNLLASPAIPREERMNTLDAAFRDQIPLSMLTLMRLMVYRGHARELPAMTDAFRDILRENRGEAAARVDSAVPLTEAEQEKLKAKLEARFGKKMILDLYVDETLLGGIRVETEGRVLDGTLRTRLQEMKEVMDS